jgi:4,5-dihydroxyphthalate decarboxylase
MFRHSAIYIRSDRGIETPADLRGRRVGVPEYQMSAAMWVRGLLQDEFGIAAQDLSWVQAGLEQAGRRDKFPLNLPDGFPLTSAPAGATLSQMLADGALDAVISARRPSCFVAGHPAVRRLFPDYRAAERDYFRRSGLFPIMHAVGIRRELLEQHPWLAASVYKAFLQAKRIADDDLAETTALKIGLPWVNAELEATREAMGADFWSYGVNANRTTLETMARYSYEQGLAVRLLSVEDMFAPGTLRETAV